MSQADVGSKAEAIYQRPWPAVSPRESLPIQRWKTTPWTHREIHGEQVTTRPVGSPHAVQHGVAGLVAHGATSLVFGGHVIQPSGIRVPVVIKYLRDETAFKAVRRSDLLIAAAGARNPMVHRHFLTSMLSWEGPVERTLEYQYRSRVVVQPQVDRWVGVMSGANWVRRYPSDPERSAAMGCSLAIALHQLNLRQPDRGRLLHTDLKPGNLAITVHPDGRVGNTIVFDNASMQQEASFRLEEWNTRYTDPALIRSSPLWRTIRAGGAQGLVDRMHVWSVAKMVYDQAGGWTRSDGAVDPRILQQLRGELPAVLAAGLATDPADRPGIHDLAIALQRCAGTFAPLVPASASATPHAPSVPRAVSMGGNSLERMMSWLRP